MREVHGEQGKALRREIATQWKDRRDDARVRGRELKIERLLWAREAAMHEEALQKRQAAERRTRVQGPKVQVWREWLVREAGRGDEAARAALRGIRYREQRKKGKVDDALEGEDLEWQAPLTVAGMRAEVDHRGMRVIYRGEAGREKFVDTGPCIIMKEGGRESLEAALRIAAQKYGGRVNITGSAEFRERAARQAARLGIGVRDTDLQAVVTGERAKMRMPAAPVRRKGVER